MHKELSLGGGGFNRDGARERPESGPVRKLGTAPGRLSAGPGRGLRPSTHLGAVSSRSGGRRWRRQPRGASLPSLMRGPGRARGSSRQRRGGAEAPAPRSGGCRKGAAEQRGAGGRRAGRGLLPPPPRRAAPPPRSPLPRPEHRPRRAQPPIRGRRPQPQAPKAGAASSVSERRRRRRCRRQTRFLRPLRPLPAARAGPSDGRGGTRRLRGLGPGGGARQAGREEPREKGRGAGATRAASC